MPRDALPQHEINVIITRLQRGEKLEDIAFSMPDVDPVWFSRNEASLNKAAGITAPAPPPEREASPPPPVVEEPVPEEPPEAEPAEAHHRKAKRKGR